MIKYSYRTNGLTKLSNCNIDVIKTCNNDNIGMKAAYLYFQGFSHIFQRHEYANYANTIACIFDHRMKGLCLRFN